MGNEAGLELQERDDGKHQLVSEWPHIVIQVFWTPFRENRLPEDIVCLIGEAVFPQVEHCYVNSHSIEDRSAWRTVSLPIDLTGRRPLGGTKYETDFTGGMSAMSYEWWQRFIEPVESRMHKHRMEVLQGRARKRRAQEEEETEKATESTKDSSAEVAGKHPHPGDGHPQKAAVPKSGRDSVKQTPWQRALKKTQDKMAIQDSIAYALTVVAKDQRLKKMARTIDMSNQWNPQSSQGGLKGTNDADQKHHATLRNSEELQALRVALEKRHPHHEGLGCRMLSGDVVIDGAFVPQGSLVWTHEEKLQTLIYSSEDLKGILPLELTYRIAPPALDPKEKKIQEAHAPKALRQDARQQYRVEVNCAWTGLLPNDDDTFEHASELRFRVECARTPCSEGQLFLRVGQVEDSGAISTLDKKKI
jgi:hypothetical protein